MPDRTLVVVITKTALRSEAGLERLLDAFDNVEGFTPTHWGQDERARDPYDRTQLIREVSSLKGEFGMPGLQRRKPPRYKAYFSAKNGGVKIVNVEFSSTLSEKELPRVFSFGDALAEQLKAEFGIVHLAWNEGHQEYNASGVITVDELQKYGPTRVCARTWFGPHIVRLIGEERLRTSGALVKKTSWGGVQLDLMERPWESNVEALSARQDEVMRQLAPSGIFGDYSQFLNYKQGANWVSIPVEDAA
ncbi:MAG: hypothetical protein QOH63_2963 [Acidobacteriota bacterium]|jgi:hypothetical protein|nr:hypothetical protein [Acidobacteriota bacterium]